MLGERLRALRESAGLSQEQLALDIESSEPQIWRYEKGKSKPGADVVKKLARYFHVSADYLLGVTNDPSENLNYELRPNEAAVIDAWRRGEKYQAIKTIMDDE